MNKASIKKFLTKDSTFGINIDEFEDESINLCDKFNDLKVFEVKPKVLKKFD